MLRTTMVSTLIATLSACVVLTPDGAWAQEATAQYRSILASAYAADEPGAAALVAQGDRIVYLDAVGMADLELGVPLAPDMVFEIGSITKQFTAAATMLLVEEGRLALDDPITRHLPDYPSYGDSITVEHLLTHTSGIVSYTNIPGYITTEVRKDLAPAALIDVFDDLPVEFAPGERYAYNNSGYVLLGAIIEAASGMSYEKFVEERLFGRLGMEHAYYGCSQCLIPRRASGYDGGDDGYTNQQYLSFTQPYAAGALMMTVENWHRWTRALFGGEVVSAESLERMTTPYRLTGGESTGYGYGLAVGDVRGRRVIRHGGGIFGFSASGMYLPEQGVYVAVFANNTGHDVGPGLVATKLAALAIGDPFPQFEEIVLAEDVLRRYAGVYRINDDAQRVVTVRDGALYTRRTGGEQLRAYPATETHFFYRTSLSHFEFVIEDGAVTGMLMYQGGRREAEEAVKISDDIPSQETIDLDRAILERYVGVYALEYDRPGYELTFFLEGDRLMTRGNWGDQEAVEVRPTSLTEFFIEAINARITFDVAPDGTVGDLILHMDGRHVPGRRRN